MATKAKPRHPAQGSLWHWLADRLEAEERARAERRHGPVCPRPNCHGLRLPDPYEPELLTCVSCGRSNRPRVNPKNIVPDIPEASDAYYQHVIKTERKRARQQQKSVPDQEQDEAPDSAA